MKKAMKAIVALAVATGMAFGALADETTLDLSKVKEDTIIADGTKVVGELKGKYKISIADGAAVMLVGATIPRTSKDWPGITCMGDATITLVSGTKNEIESGYGDSNPGIFIPKGKTLTIDGDGELSAYGWYGAGIGGSSKACGNIVINGGKIFAYGHKKLGTPASVTIVPGSPSLLGARLLGSYSDAVGIGCHSKKCGSITINGGSVEAEGRQGGAGIGGGSCAGITINGGNVKAISSPSGYPFEARRININKGIGAVHAVIDGDNIKDGDRFFSSVPVLDASYNSLKREAPYYGYGDHKWGRTWNGGDLIGVGSASTVRITSYVGRLEKNKTFKNGDALIGTLRGDHKISIAKNATVIFDDLTIGDSLESEMPGITCLGNATIIIQGKNYIKGHGSSYPGIFVPESCTLSIKTVLPNSPPSKIGVLTAVSGGKYGAGIGGCHPDFEASGAYGGPCGTVAIYGGRVTAIGGECAAAIGGRFKQSKTSTTIRKWGAIPALFGGTIRTEGGVLMQPHDRDEIFDSVEELQQYESDFFTFLSEDNVYRYMALGEFAVGDGVQEFRWYGGLHGIHPYTGCVEAYDGTYLHGVLNQDVKISIVPNATVTLSEAAIPWQGTQITENGEVVYRRGDYAALTCEGDATIILASDTDNMIRNDTNFESWGTYSHSQTDDNGYYPAIYVPEGHTLTIDGDGKLVAMGGKYGAGIGAGYKSERSCGNIVIKNGVIMAIGGERAPGIGNGYNGGVCSGISIEGGLVMAIGGPGNNGNRRPPFLPEPSIVEHFGYSVGTVGDYDITKGYLWQPAENSNSTRFEYDEWGTFSHNEFEVYNDQLCKLIGPPEELGKFKKSNGGNPPRPLSARPGAGPRLLDSSSSWDCDLSKIKNHYCDAIAGDGFVFTGTLSDRFKIAIADGATVTLRNVNILGGHDDSSPYAGLTCLGSATLILEGSNTVSSFHGRYPGIFVPTNSVLRIEGPGTLVASSAGYADSTGYGAGIGGGYELDCGMIYVSGGLVTANGGTYAAGIGGGYKASCTGVSIGTGIGRVVAVRGESGVMPIGYGLAGTCPTPSIGRGLSDETVNNSRRTLQWNGNLGYINDEMETVTAFDGTTIYGMLGSACRCKVQIAPGAHVTLENATIGCSLSNADFNGAAAPWAGLTCLGDATVTLIGANTVSSFNAYYPCIYVPRGSTLTVKGGDTDSLLVRNTADGALGAGIGGGYKMDCGKIVLDGGNIMAQSAGSAAAIGCGYTTYCEGVELGAGLRLLDAQVPASSSAQAAAHEASPLGRSGYGTCAYVRASKGLNEIDTGNWWHARYTGNPNVDLSTVTTDKRITTGALVTGTLSGSREITIASGAEVTLKDVRINGSTAGLKCEGGATIYLEGTNYVSGSAGWPGIYVPPTKTLRIDSENGGYLEAEGGSGSAGIGAGSRTENKDCGTILIDGGVISATGNGAGAGIGAAGSGSTCEDIIINYGTVTAYGTYAGIGRGQSGSCEGIYIRGGIETVAVCAMMNANNGITQAEEVEIDSGLRDNKYGNIRILSFNPDINLQSSGSVIVATNTATISGSCINTEKKITIAAGATVTLSNVTIRSTHKENCKWAGITCEGDATIILVGTNTVTGFHERYPGIYVPAHATLTIKGDGSLDASSNGYGAGIGAGSYYQDSFKNCGNIVVESGSIVATGGYGSAGIGGAYRSSCGDITIKGGIVAATGGKEAAGIGCGALNGDCGKITIGDNVKVITAIGGQDDGSGKGEAIGASSFGMPPNGLYVSGSLVDLSEDGDPVNKRTIMAKSLDLGAVVSDVTLLDGVTAWGTLPARYKVSIAAGATVTLDSATISFASDIGSKWAGLTCIGDATLVLKGTSTVKSFYQGYPGILVPTNSTLVIEGDGALNASCSDHSFPNAAGIGGCGSGSGADCGRIVINSGTVTATGHSAAGIGSANFAFEGIEINGGVVTATGRAGGAGIGAGPSNPSCGDIVINGGTVTATAQGESSGAGIGGGRYGFGANVTIGAGVTRVVATTTDGSPIGSGNSAQPVAATVDESLVDTTSGSTRTIAPPVVVDLSTVTGNLILENGTIATGTLGVACKVSIAAGAAVTLANVIINIDGVAENTTCKWAGLTCASNATIVLEGANVVKGFHKDCAGIYVPKGSMLTIRGNGSLDASSNGRGAGIGGGYYISCGNIVIDGGVITATGSGSAAGIGGGYNISCGNIVISGGTVNASGGGSAAGIGSGYMGTCGDINIGAGITRVVATSNNDYAQPIGMGAGTTANCGDVNVDPTLMDNNGRPTRTIIDWDGNLAELDRDVVVKDGTTLYGTLQGNYKVSITNGATVALSDAVINLPEDQTREWAGLTCLGDARIILEGENVVRGSHAYYPGIHVPVGSTLTIEGDGTLDASSNGRGAGIGGGWNVSCGNIVIAGGTVNAVGGSNCAGIGGGYPKLVPTSCGNITINSGIAKVIATAGPAAEVASSPAAPIGGAPAGPGGSCACGTITVAPSLLDMTSYLTRTILSAPTYEEWVAGRNAQGASISGAWDDTDANGVPNALRYAFDKAESDFGGNVILGFEADGEGRVALQTLPVVNGRNLFTFTVVASDNPDGTGYVMEYPLSLDMEYVLDDNGVVVFDEQTKQPVTQPPVTIIEEEYNPNRFFRVRITPRQ